MMHQQQVAVGQHDMSSVPRGVADAAARYQTFRKVEAEQLALMASHNLLEDWTPEVRLTVLAARETVRQAREARAGFRSEVRALITTMRARAEPLPVALRLTRQIFENLEREGAIRGDDGWLEAEVLEWVIEDYESVS